jgi:hypothetical protein
MYAFFLAMHNIVRWVALILAVVATVTAFLGWFGKRQWSERDRKIGSFFGIAMDIQLLLGLLLYFVFSPITRTALQDFGAAMGVQDLRFFGLEHAFYMILAVVFAHLGSILARRAPESKAKFQRAAIFFGLSLLLILLGIPWGRPLFPGL